MSDGTAYSDAIGALRFAMRFGVNPSLDGIQLLTGALGRPQEAFRVVQVTGTNGKTSVTRMCAALLAAAGAKVGAYTSPHLLEYRERVEIGGSPVSEAEFSSAVAAALEVSRGVAARASAGGRDSREGYIPFTEFELLTAAALTLLARQGVEWAVLEVGMGGRWDATSVASPEVAVVTGVALDHVARLGTTIERIAEDKAQVIKPGCVAVLGPGTEPVDAILAERARAVGAAVVRVREASGGSADGDLGEGGGRLVTYSIGRRPEAPDGSTGLRVSGLRGIYDLELRSPSYQAPNAAVAVAAAEAALHAPLDPVGARAALAALTFPGRFDVLLRRPWLVADGAHNPQAASTLAGAVAEAFPRERPIAVLAVLDDKDAAGIVEALAPAVVRFVAACSESERALPPDRLGAIIREVTGEAPEARPSVPEALELALAEGDTVATGSLTTAGDAVRWARREGRAWSRR